MAVFKYIVLDSSGKKRAGTVEANSKELALGLLKQDNNFVISLEESRESPFDLLASIGGISTNDVVAFTRQFSTMISSGISLARSLEVLIDQVDNPKFRKVLTMVLKDVEGGSSLADALSKHPDVFSRTYQALVRAGESSGTLDVVLKRLATSLEADRDLRSRFRNAMIYPAIVLVAMVGVFILMMVMVVPQLAGMYKSLDVPLPLPTQIMIKVSDFMTAHFLVTFLLLVSGVLGIAYFKRTEFGKHLLTEISFKAPVFGKINKTKELTSFSRTLSLLIGSAIPIVEALHIVAQVVDSDALREALVGAATYVERGNSLSEYFRGNKIFPPLIGQMSGVGEETGKMDEVLEKVADYYEGETTSAIENLSAALEPLILILLGVMVGLIVYSIIMPIYKITTSI